VDFETTGLDPAVDDILSIGAVAIEGGDIQTASAHYDVIAFDGALDEETLVIHGLTHDALSQGIALDEAMQRFFALAKGAILVAHSANIERGFLDAYCQAHCGAPFETLWVCTLQLERKRASAQQGELSVRLGQSRERYNLPRYTAHHALIDALAGAELLLAQAAHRSGGNCRLRDLL
jgi:DNA polymerase-3 subunit epsilon